jgi:outer membrane receptor protein involved in Fe transport
LVDGRIGLRDIELGRGRFELAVYAKNLFNKDAYTFAPAVIGQNVFYDERRTYGIELRTSF